MARYALPRHVFVCLQGEHVVFLDVRRDRYFALEARQTAGLRALVKGWPAPLVSRTEFVVAHAVVGGTAVAAEAQPATNAGSDVTAALDLLLERGLLIESIAEGKDATPVSVEPLTDELTVEGFDSPKSMGARAALRFMLCGARASMALKLRSFESVVKRVSRRNVSNRAAHEPLDTPRVQRLIGAFVALRPYFFTSKDECLFEALALSDFLARYGVFPNWVFGVQARPFAAHCWLQQDGIVLNDTVDHISRYTPIMCV